MEPKMPIKFWPNGAVLVYKGAKVVVPALLAAAGAAIGFIVGKKSK